MESCGVVPQCGFSVSATNLYAARVITLGTLIAVYLSTSDEMLPILLSEAVPITTILAILGIKLVIGVIAGFIIDFILRIKNKNGEEQKIIDLCEKEHCDCEHGIFKSALKHTLNIFIFIFIVTIIINIAIYLIGEEQISGLLQSKPILGPILAGLIRINSKLCFICYFNTNVFRKCYLNINYDFRHFSWCRSGTSSII